MHEVCGCWVYVSSDVPDCVAQAAEELTATGRFRWHNRNAFDNDDDDEDVAATEGEGVVPLDLWRKLKLAAAKAGNGGAAATTTSTPVLPEVGSDGLLLANPLGTSAPSERELVCENLWRKVYRALFIKI